MSIFVVAAPSMNCVYFQAHPRGFINLEVILG